MKNAKTPNDFAKLILAFIQYIDLEKLKFSMTEERFQKWKQDLENADSLSKVAVLLSLFHRSLKLPDLTVSSIDINS